MSRTRLLSAPRSFLFSSGDSRPVSGIRLGFAQISGGESGGESCHTDSSYFMDVTDISDRRLMITFHNRGSDTCAITDIYFSDGGQFSISVQGMKDAGAAGAASCYLAADEAGGHSIPDPFDASGNFRVINRIPRETEAAFLEDGIHSSESLGIVFDLQAGITLVDVVGALSDGRLTISLRVQDGERRASGLLINESTLSLKPAW